MGFNVRPERYRKPATIGPIRGGLGSLHCFRALRGTPSIRYASFAAAHHTDMMRGERRYVFRLMICPRLHFLFLLERSPASSPTGPGVRRAASARASSQTLMMRTTPESGDSRHMHPEAVAELDDTIAAVPTRLT
jgi:hypothetical protein